MLSFLVGWAVLAVTSVSCAEKVCIVGSGIGGSSVAKFLREVDGDLELHVFEKRPEIGGRTKTVTFDQMERPVDVGATILHKENRYLIQFAAELHLEVLPTRESYSSVGDAFGSGHVAGGSWGIYDGKEFLFESGGSETVDAGKLWWRYGNDLRKMQQIVKEFLERFKQIYILQSTGLSFTTPVDLLKTISGLLNVWKGVGSAMCVELYEWTQISLEEGMKQRGISQKLVDELMTAVNRVNYGQDSKMNGLAGMIGLSGAGSDLRVVKGGVQQISNGLLKMSGAKVHVNTTVQEIVKDGEGFELKLTPEGTEKCDAVVIAAPLEQSDLTLPPTSAPVLHRDFHLTQTTFVKGMLKPSFFGKKLVPSSIYTTENEKLQFNSIGCMDSEKEMERVCKVFSRAPLTEEFLNEAFENVKVLKVIPWRAYPHFQPPEKFSPFVLEKGLVYINTIESAASAMEVSAVGAKNAALLIQKWLQLGQKASENLRDNVQIEL